MQYSKIDKLGVSISKLGFGGMRLPFDSKNNPMQDEINKIVAHAYNGGVNYYDTSIVYGPVEGSAEKALGKALKQFPRESYYLADKMPFYASMVRKENHLDSYFEEELANLGTDYIDFYIMHGMDTSKFELVKELGALEWAQKKREEGKIKYIGFSFHDQTDVLFEIANSFDWDFVQIQYNYYDVEDTTPGQKGFEWLAKKGIPTFIMEPLRGGLLTELPGDITEPFSKLQKTPAEMGYRWLLDQEGVTMVLSGVSTMEHIEENVKTFSGHKPLTSEEKEAINQVKSNISKKQQVGCTGCAYCMPCPSNINIPAEFRAWNTREMKPAKNWIPGTMNNVDAISGCTECGLCAAKCPQHIDIPAKLKELLAAE